MSTRGNIPQAGPRRVLAIIISTLSVLTSLSLLANPAAAAPKTTTTTTASGGTSGGGGAAPKLTAVVSLSRHRLLGTYDRALDAAALQVSTYQISSTQAVNLPVTAVSRATDNQVYLLTGAQEAVTYEVRKPKTPRPIRFTGSTLAEPRLQSARAVSTTQIVLTFSEPMGTGADQPSSYKITPTGGTQLLAVEKAALTANQVILTTAPQQGVGYDLTVADIQSASGVYMDPTAMTTQFTGSTVPDGPMLLHAEPQGDTGVLLAFDRVLAPSAHEVNRYSATPGFTIQSAALVSGGKQVQLTTSPLYDVQYTVTANVVDVDGRAINPNFNSASFTGTRVIGTERPKVTSALSTGNTSVVVQFSKPMADNATNPGNYFIIQQNMNPEVAYVPITGAAFVDANRLSVKLTTRSQNETTYQVTATNVTDVLGNPLADKLIVNGVLVADPTSFTFPGTAPTGAEILNSDCLPGDADDGDPSTHCDTLPDHQEYFGWLITVKLGTGQTATRQVTSNPDVDDSDGDGLFDDVEKALNIDPRDPDTDDDGLADYSEFNEYYSDPTNQDSDADGLFDGLEATFFFTSPLFDDTDGDQLKDGYEISVNRNPKVADLPQPALEVGEMRMGLDIRFTESNGETTRQLDAKSVQATLVQSTSQEFASSESTTHEVSATVSQKFQSVAEVEGGLFAAIKAKKRFGFETKFEVSNTNSFTSEFSQASTVATERAHSDSLTTEKEATKDSNVIRSVDAAQIQLAVTLKSRGNIAFTVKNMQVAALMPDPLDPTSLTPIATLVPETGLETAFNLGPLVPPKGPIVFASSTVYPHLVDYLMKNPQGLVFRFANYDVLDEAGRNFAFTSQEINDRTARIAIDYGGFDADGDGRGENTEILRVATGVVGRRVVDTNGDGVINGDDRKVVFDAAGRQAGISLRDALTMAGLTGYDEAATPSSSLPLEERKRSYSTLRSADGLESVFRVRDRQIQPGSPRSWEVVTATGIDYTIGLDDRVLYPGTNVILMFLQDLDKDGLPAINESLSGCIDSPDRDSSGKFKYRDTDGDGLDDRFETLVGWEVDTNSFIGGVYSKCYNADSDGDGLGDRDEAPGLIKYDPSGHVVFDNGSAARTVNDLVIKAGSPIVTSATANFSFEDVGVPISGTRIPANTTILSIQSSTQATMSANAEALTIPDPPPDPLPVDPPTGVIVTASIGAWYTLENAPKRDISGSRSVSDLKTTTGSPIVTSASAAFAARDVGVSISSGSGIPAYATILSVQSATQATMTVNATETTPEAGIAASIGTHLADAAIYDPITDPLTKDTDSDGLSDKFELTAYTNGLNLPLRRTSPELHDSEFDGLSDGVERKLGADPRSDDHLTFIDSDRDGLTDAVEVGDDNNDFVIDDNERGNAGWDVTVTQMHRRLDSTQQPYQRLARIGSPTGTGAFQVFPEAGQNLEVGTVVEIKEEGPTATTPALTTSLVKLVGGFGLVVATFGDPIPYDSLKTLYAYRTICKNGTCPAQRVTTVERTYSSKFDPDTDDDGLSDFEERKLGTDPGCTRRSDPADQTKLVLDCKPDQADTDLDGDGVRDGWDTDGDGLTDFQEVRGFKLADGTTVKTKPANVDTDNDRRSDGDEAGLPGGEYVVRLPGGVIYQVPTHPNKPDGDFDLVVDGDEQVWGIDPTLPNTDKDNQSDYSELLSGRRPEVPDMIVKMNFARLEVKVDGEKNDDAGDFTFEFRAVKTDGTNQLVVYSDKVDRPGEQFKRLPLAGLHPEYQTVDGACPGDNRQDQCWHTTNSGATTVVRIHDASGVPFTTDGSGREVVIGSVSTTDAVPEEFGIKGFLSEWDGGANDQLACRYEIFPDIFGNPADGTGVVKGSQLRLGTQSMAIHRTGAQCGDSESVDFTLMVSYTAL